MRAIAYNVTSERTAHQWAGVSRYAFDKTIDRLKKAIEQQDLWLIHEINPQALLARADMAIGKARQLLFFHPRYMEKLLLADARALPEVPLKIVLVETADGKTILRGPDIRKALAHYHGMSELAAELEKLLITIVGAVVPGGVA